MANPWRPPVLIAGIALVVSALHLASASAAVYHVDASAGVDGPSCGSSTLPCATIQQAVDLAVEGDWVLVAQGIYVGAEECPIGAPPGVPTVLCVQKQLTIVGGFDPPSDNWLVPDPELNPTIIDGQNLRRGVVVNRPEAGLRMEGFTIRSGLADTGGNAFGGGMWVVLAGRGLTLKDTTFLDNTARAGLGKQAGGGGLAVQGDASVALQVSLERVRFESNDSFGGGEDVFGSGLGGGLHVDHASLTGFDIELINNLAAGSHNSDGLGGGASFSFGALVALERVLAIGNVARGGEARSGFGGAIFSEGNLAVASEVTELILTDAELRNNRAEGGGGATPSGAGGGALLADTASATLDRVSVLENNAIGGRDLGGSVAAFAGGGGVFFWASTPGMNPDFTVQNSVIAKNVSEGTQGGGGGLRLLGATASVVHTTVAENQHIGSGLGHGINAGPAPPAKPAHVSLEDSVVAGHAAGEAVFLQSLSETVYATGTFAGNHFAGNDSDRCNPEGPLCTDDSPAANWNGWGPGGGNSSGPLDFFVDAPAADFHLNGRTPPTDSAVNSTESVDLDGAIRDSNPDIGADEYGANAYRLVVHKRGLGSGSVFSDVPGIDCGVACNAFFPSSQTVVLTATPVAGSTFTGFTGTPDCSDGAVSMSSEIECDAKFAPSGPAKLIVEKRTIPAGRADTFTFTGDVVGSIADGQQLVVSSLEPGAYSITETDHALFELSAIACDDEDSPTPSSTNLTAHTATVALDPGETVTCVFTNTLTSCSAGEADLDLPSQTVENNQVFQACNSITAGPFVVGSTGSVTLEALEIVLREGFEVIGELAAVLNVP